MELRVAKALFKPPHPQATFDAMPDVVRGSYVELSRAAIRAMREPTKGMLQTEYVNVSAWESMIDAASPALPAMKEE